MGWKLSFVPTDNPGCFLPSQVSAQLHRAHWWAAALWFSVPAPPAPVAAGLSPIGRAFLSPRGSSGLLMKHILQVAPSQTQRSSQVVLQHHQVIVLSQAWGPRTPSQAPGLVVGVARALQALAHQCL